MANRYSYETAGKRLWHKLEPEALRMRKSPTPAEDALWQALRGGKLGVRFRRQHAIGRFIVDFMCLPAKLIVEVDGGIHSVQTGRDDERETLLRCAGYQVLRVSNDEVLHNLDQVLQKIGDYLKLSR